MCTKSRPADDVSVIARFMSYLDVSTTHFWRGEPCMFWTGGKSRGGDRWSEKAWYGTFNPGGVVSGGVRAHVFAAWLAGLIADMRVPEGMNIDHGCVQGLCCNPLHLEVVTKLVNQHRKYRREETPMSDEDDIERPFVPDKTLTERITDLLGSSFTPTLDEDGWLKPIMVETLKVRETDPNAPTVHFDHEYGWPSLDPDRLRSYGIDFAEKPDCMGMAIAIIAHEHPRGSAAAILGAMGGSIINGDIIYVPLEISCGDPDHDAKMAGVEGLLLDASRELFGGPRRSAEYVLRKEPMPEMMDIRPEIVPQSVRDGTPRSPKQTMRARQPQRQRRGKGRRR